nr:type III secretion system chaperone [Robbsia andropogonis]
MEIVIQNHCATARPRHGTLLIDILHEADDGHDQVMLTASLGRPHPERDADVDKRLLEANHLGLGTSGCTLGRDSAQGNVSIYARLPLDLLDADALQNALDAFHAIASDWYGNIHRDPDTRNTH